MHKKTRNILGIIVLLTIAVFVYFKTGRNGTLNKKDYAFALKDTNGITEISFKNSTQKITLSKNGENWILNNESPVGKKRMDLFLKNLTSLKMKYPVSQTYAEEINSQLEQNGIDVKVIKGKRTVLQYKVVKDSIHNSGYIIKKQKAKKAFVVEFYSSFNQLNDLFDSNPTQWKENILISLIPSEIEEIKLVYPAKNMEENGFEIIQLDTGYIVKDYAGNTINESEIYDRNIIQYLSYFGNIEYKKYLGKINKAMGDTLQQNCYAQLHVKSKDKQELSFTFSDIYLTIEGKRKKDLNYMHVGNNTNKEYSLATFIELAPLLKTKEYFLKDNE